MYIGNRVPSQRSIFREEAEHVKDKVACNVSMMTELVIEHTYQPAADTWPWNILQKYGLANSLRN